MLASWLTAWHVMIWVLAVPCLALPLLQLWHRTRVEVTPGDAPPSLNASVLPVAFAAGITLVNGMMFLPALQASTFAALAAVLAPPTVIIVLLLAPALVVAATGSTRAYAILFVASIAIVAANLWFLAVYADRSAASIPFAPHWTVTLVLALVALPTAIGIVGLSGAVAFLTGKLLLRVLRRR